MIMIGVNGKNPFNYLQAKDLKDWIIPLYKIYSDDEDVKLISKVIKRGRDWAIGPEID